MLVLDSARQAQEVFLKTKKQSPIAFVPTMGCLHEGHLDLVKLAKTKAAKVIVSIFVNPLQFGPNEDFNQYPRTFEEDKQKLEALKVDFLFYPSATDLYPPLFSNSIEVGKLGNRLCGQFRPGHFNGVATVCLKLFQITQADFAIFGQKDYQQLQVIKNLVRDFNLPLQIIGHPTVRDRDGLALSSRNRFLSADERKKAQLIPQTLEHLRKTALLRPDLLVEDLCKEAKELLASLDVQYSTLTDGPELETAQSQKKLKELQEPRFFIAAKLGNTRLIDNIALREDDL